LDDKKLQEIKESLQVTKRWYHKIPYIGKKIYTKQKWRKYEKIKPKLFSIVCEEVNKEVEKNNLNFFNQFAYINNVSLGDINQFSESSNVYTDNVKQMTIKNINIDKYKNICKTIRL